MRSQPRSGRSRVATLAMAMVVLCSVMAAQNPAAVKRGAYFTGRYRNLFREDGHLQHDIQEKIDDAYEHLFLGNGDSEAVYFNAGGNANGRLAYIIDTGNGDVRTEGMSYGMMIAVQLGHRAEFDALWNWARTYMYIDDPKHPGFGYYAWTCKTNGEHNSDTSAPDGEEYFAMSLYFASARWGDGDGIYNYHARADEILRTMVHHPTTKGPTRFGERVVGPEFDAQQKMVTFIAEPSGSGFTDPSYHLPGFYELWSRWGPAEDRVFWAEAAKTSRAFFAKATDPHTGLAPVNANFDGTSPVAGAADSGKFGPDSWRTASNWSWDYAWFASDPEEAVLSNRLQAFFASQGASYGRMFTLDGKVIDGTPATGLIATNAVTSLAVPWGARSSTFTEALWNAAIPRGPWRYYDGMLYMLSLLHVSGQFRIWTPSWAAAAR